MDTNLLSKMKLCAFADEADPNLDGQIAALKANNIEYLEIRGVNGKNISVLTSEEVKDAKAKLDDSGIKVWSIGSPIGKIDINAQFEPHLDMFCNLLDTAKTLGASHFRLFSFYGTNGGMEDVVFEKLNKFVEKAKGSNIILCHENESGIYGDVALRCVRIHQNIPSIKAVFDPANFIQCSQDTVEAWKSLSSYVEYIHVKDALQGGKVVPAGYGAGNVQLIIEDFANHIYNKTNNAPKLGVLSIEPHLFAFVGLKQLEGGKSEAEIDAKVGSLSFNNSREAFDAAANALKAIL